ncbi:PIG-L deacetylase family protein [Halomicronema sp. CCY15110]|uniref:PIG-L deacetylase family protein n=1 Tax=Halomicronema sp. CCY15110 TaxID=2767773 RepID=UPI001951EEE0|nr:PIG-L deacetylase family protein [Halomicronema sp. CCY15110]
MSQSIVVIAPHPDDEVLGCGGAIARHTDGGDDVHIVAVTRADPDLYPAEEEVAFREEVKAAHQVLGVASTVYLDFPAPRLDTIASYQLAAAIAQVICQLRPHTVYLPHHGDLHADHQRVYEATLVAARPINGCSVRQLLAYETLSETEWAPPRADCAFVPTTFINIEPYLATKLKAMTCYRSELKAFPHPRSLEALTALAKLRGAAAGLAAAEAFTMIRQIL